MPSKRLQAPVQTTRGQTQQEPLPTFLDHVHELRRRLFWAVGTVLVASSAAYPVMGTIIDILLKPLGNQSLVYLTPAGGFAFMIKLCAYVGFAVGVPVIMYHIYKFIEPLMGKWRKPAVFYVSLSTFFAAAGVAFAYFISLPAALKFLTGFNLQNIEAMLTIDSYLSFVVTYLLGAALLFQIPLLLMIINTMTPLKPNKLLGAQRFVVVGAFVIGAIISPTPDIMNQTILALPVVAMYNLGVLLVWMQNRSRNKKKAVVQAAQKRSTRLPDDVLEELRKFQLSSSSAVPARAASNRTMTAQKRSVLYGQRSVASVARLNPSNTKVPAVAKNTGDTQTIRHDVRTVDGLAATRPLTL